MAETYNYVYQPKVRLEAVISTLNTLNASSYEAGLGACGCREMAIQTKTTNITEAYTYDVYFWTP